MYQSGLTANVNPIVDQANIPQVEAYGWWDDTVSVFDDLIKQGGEMIGQAGVIVKDGYLDDLRNKYKNDGENDNIENQLPENPRSQNALSGGIDLSILKNPIVISGMIGASALILVTLLKK